MDFSNIYLDSWAVDDNTALIAGMTIGISIGIAVIAIIIAVLRGFSVRRIVKARGLNGKAVFCFIPIVQSFLIGKISDNIAITKKKKARINRFFLIVFNVFRWVAFVFVVLKIVNLIWDFATLCTKYPDWIPINEAFSQVLDYFVAFAIPFVLFLVASLVHSVFFHIAIYQIFSEYTHDEAPVMTIISVVLGSLVSLLLLVFVSKKAMQSQNSTEVSFS